MTTSNTWNPNTPALQEIEARTRTLFEGHPTTESSVYFTYVHPLTGDIMRSTFENVEACLFTAKALRAHFKNVHWVQLPKEYFTYSWKTPLGDWETAAI